MTNRLVVIVVFAAASLCVTRSAQAQLKYFGYVGSDTIGAGICTPSCSAEAQDHVNIAWLDGSIPPASVAAQIDSAASRGQRVIIDIQTLLFLKDPEKGYLRFRPDPSGLFQALMDGGVGSRLGQVAAFFSFDEPFWNQYSNSGSCAGQPPPCGNPTTRQERQADLMTARNIAHAYAPQIPIMVIFNGRELFPSWPSTIPGPHALSPEGTLNNGVTGYADWLGYDCYIATGDGDGWCDMPGQGRGVYTPAYFLNKLKENSVYGAGQRLFLVPDGYYAHGAPDTTATQALVNAATAYNDAATAYNNAYSASLVVPTVTGIFPFVWASPWAGLAGTRDIPNLKTRYQQIGSAIIAPHPNPAMSVDIPANGASVTQSFTVAGWALDQGGLAGTGVDVVQVYAWRAGVATFLGTAAYGGGRPDVAGYYGAQYLKCGYSLTVSGPNTLSPGAYDIVVYARSTVTGTFNAQAGRSVTIPNSNPAMNVDIPSANQTVAPTFTVAGWAIDLGAPYGPGVDMVDVHAVPLGGNGIYLGSAAIGGNRPDLAAAYGEQFRYCGFSLTASLGSGVYDIQVYTRSTLTGTFNNARVVRITIP